MIGMAGVCKAMQTHLEAKLATSIVSVRTIHSLTADDLPVPRAIVVDDVPVISGDDLPAILIIPQRRARPAMGDVEDTTSSYTYKFTYELRLDYATSTTETRAAAGLQRMYALEALSDCLIRNPGIVRINPAVGSATVATGTYVEVYGPIAQKPNTTWYAEAYATMTVNTVELMEETPLAQPPLDVMLDVELIDEVLP